MLMPEDKLLRWPSLKVSSFCYLFRDTEELPTKPLLLLANWSMLNGPFGSCQTKEQVEYAHIFCIMMENYNSCKHRGLLEPSITIRQPCFGSEETKDNVFLFDLLWFLLFHLFNFSHFHIFIWFRLFYSLRSWISAVKGDDSEFIHYQNLWGCLFSVLTEVQ